MASVAVRYSRNGVFPRFASLRKAGGVLKRPRQPQQQQQQLQLSVVAGSHHCGAKRFIPSSLKQVDGHACHSPATLLATSPFIAQRRRISATAPALHGDDEHEHADKPMVQVTWVNKHGDERVTPARCGMNLMRTAHKYDVELEGACEGVCACSTCHVILEEDVYDRLPEPSEEEEDMLDQAFQLTPTSRLGCQVVVTEDMDRMRIKLPSATRNFYVDGHVPKPH